MIQAKDCDLKELFSVNIPNIKDIPQMYHLYNGLFTKGKAFRAVMTYQVASCLNISKDKKNSLGRIIEYIHQSSILHDDVIDVSPIRRGALSSWMKHSMKKSILAGDYLLAQSASDTAYLGNIELMKFTAEVLQKMVKGEWIQDSIKNKESLEEVDRVHKLKTASLFQWSLRAPFLVIDRYEKPLHDLLDQIGLMIGILFQRSDDLLDFDIRNYEKKSTFKDISEGHLNSFAIYLLKDKSKEVKSIIKTCKSLKDIYKHIKKDEFENILYQFDEVNKKIIKDCEIKIEDLKYFLLKDKQSLIKELLNWPNQFYWRRNV